MLATSGVLTSATSNSFDISPGAATQLAFTAQPTDVLAGVSIAPAVQVTVRDSQGNTVTTSTAAVTLGLGVNPSGGALSGGAATAANGVATFSSASINLAGTGYALQASATGLTSALSSSFNVTAPNGYSFTWQRGDLGC